MGWWVFSFREAHTVDFLAFRVKNNHHCLKERKNYLKQVHLT